MTKIQLVPYSIRRARDLMHSTQQRFRCIALYFCLHASIACILYTLGELFSRIYLENIPHERQTTAARTVYAMRRH